MINIGTIPIFEIIYHFVRIIFYVKGLTNRQDGVTQFKIIDHKINKFYCLNIYIWHL